MTDLRNAVREAVQAIKKLGTNSIDPHIVNKVRDILAERGLGSGCHVGKYDMEDGDDVCVEWYAGQLLDIFDNYAKFFTIYINSLVFGADQRQ